VAQRGVVLLEDIDDAQKPAAVLSDGEAHGVGGAGDREVLAEAARVTTVAMLPLMLFRRGERCIRQGSELSPHRAGSALQTTRNSGLSGRVRLRCAGEFLKRRLTEPGICVSQGQPWPVGPGSGIEPSLGNEKRAGHAGIVAERYPRNLETTRIDILKQLLEQNPSSTFARYGLAMEYVKAGDLESAIAEFKAVAAADPAYSAAYFQGGQTLEKLGRLNDARGFYREGIAKTGDEHARSEMRVALDLLGPDD